MAGLEARPGTASGVHGIGPVVPGSLDPKSLAAFVAIGGDRVFFAQSKLRRRRYAECIAICTQLLEKNPYDQSVWYMKCQAITANSWVDDTEMEEQGIAEALMDSNAMAEAPRPGTSLLRPLGSESGPNMSVRPVTGSGRPVTGYARPGTGSNTGGNDSVEGAFEARPGTSRPVTSSGRFVRLGTASMLSEPGVRSGTTPCIGSPLISHLLLRFAIAGPIYQYRPARPQEVRAAPSTRQGAVRLRRLPVAQSTEGARALRARHPGFWNAMRFRLQILAEFLRNLATATVGLRF